MREILGKINDLLEPQDRRRIFLLLGLVLVTGAVEAVGIASIFPFAAVVANPDLVETNRYLSAAHSLLGYETIRGFLIFLGLVVLASILGSIALAVLTNWAILHFTSARNYSLSNRMLENYLHRPYAWFLGQHSAELNKTVLMEVGQVVNGVLGSCLQLVAQGVTALFIIIILVVVDPLLTLLVATMLGGVYWLIYRASRRRLHRKGEERLQASRERYRLSSEALAGIKDVKVLGLENAFLNRFDESSRRLFQTQIGADMMVQFPPYALRAAAFTIALGILQYQLTLRGDLIHTLPLIALFLFAGNRLMPAFQKIYQSSARLRIIKPALDAVHRDLTNQKEMWQELDQDNTDGKPLCVQDKIELRQVTYGYPGATVPTLHDVSLTIPVKTSAAVMGQTGAGKTTLVDVLLGLLDAQHGQLLVGGIPITEENRRAWQRSIGYVPQHIFLTDDTIAANIAFGVSPTEIDMIAVVRAARVANLHDFVTRELDHGYDTPIGERGVRLSGGQRQRIGIARALYRNPDLLVMDEATNALDYMTERAIMDALANVAGEKTVIVITHRLTTVRHCDVIFLMERGRIVGSGTYDELMDGDAYLREMVNSGSRSRPSRLIP